MKLMSGEWKEQDMENGEIVEYNARDREGTGSIRRKMEVLARPPGRPTSV